jgi:hypothetical protein
MSEAVKCKTVCERSTYILDTVKVFNHEGDLREYSGWFQHAKELRGGFVHLLDFACLMHGVTPIISRETKDLPLDTLIQMLGCDEDITEEIRSTYQNLCDYLRDMPVIRPLDEGVSYGTHSEKLWNDYPPSTYCNYLQKWLNDTGQEIPQKLQEALGDYDRREDDVEYNPIARINEQIFWHATTLSIHELILPSYGLAEACRVILGCQRYHLCSPQQDFESDVYQKSKELTKPLIIIVNGKERACWDDWYNVSGLRELYQTATVAIQKGELVTLTPSQKETPQHCTLELKIFVDWCKSIGIHIRSQLQERFLSDVGSNDTLLTSIVKTKQEAELVRYIETLNLEDAHVPSGKKDYVHKQCKTFYASDTFPADLKNGKPLSNRACDRVWEKAKNCKRYAVSGNASQRRTVASAV